MGLSTHSLDQLPPPFLLADEMIFYLPKNGRIAITQEHSKFIVVLDGEAEHTYDGQPKRQPLKAGDIFVSIKGRDHVFYNPDKRHVSQLHVFRLFISNEAMHAKSHRRKSKLTPENDLAQFILESFPHATHLVNAVNGDLTETLNAVRRESEYQLPGYQHKAHSLLTDLVVSVARLRNHISLAGTGALATRSSPIVASAKEFILKNLDTKLTLADIAWRTGKGEEHLTRVFKRETGQSVFDYVREMRINRAKTYLFDTSLSLTKIAELCGFSSLSYFSQTFHQITGVTPSNYREHLNSHVLPGPVNKVSS